MDDLAQVDFEARLLERLGRLYGEVRAPEILARLLDLLERDALPARPRWDERDVFLISYGDSITRRGEIPLVTLKGFLDDRLRGLISTVHILPFYPYSSDDGFAVVDYRQVNGMLGDWEDIEALGEHFDLMFDLVLNHVSSHSTWFKQFVGDRPPGKDYFIEVDPAQDLSMLVRPRVTPVPAGFETERGFVHVWATFSNDQIDLNFENPDVLLEMVDIFQTYLLHGARAVRLDAVAFLWKQLGTSCIHLWQTHEVVRLLRDVLEEVSPGAILLTETNVPHKENISYFGTGDEAHMVYQFSLPPLLLHALFTGQARYLTEWAAAQVPAPEGCTFFNFTSSHDGIGMRPVEGLLPEAEVDALVAGMQRLGGFASARTLPGGRKAVYEINITYFDAMRATLAGPDALHVARFLCSQLLALGLQGIPGLYIQCIAATPNDHEAVDWSGRLRSINRHKWARDDLEDLLDDPATPQHVVFEALQTALRVRRREPAFHPSASQRVLHLGDGVFAVERAGSLWALANVTSETLTAVLPARAAESIGGWADLLTGERLAPGQGSMMLSPYRVVWLKET